MADTTTARLALTKPEPGASTDTWGLKLNTNFDLLDTMFDTASDASTPALRLSRGGTGAANAAGARTALGLGTMATQAASAVAITGGSVAGITDLAVADGGTGASTAAAARSNLGISGVYTAQATSFTATANNTYFITGNSVVVTLPVAPEDNEFVIIADGATVTGCSVARNGKTIMGAAEDLTVDPAHFAFRLVYRSATGDWRLG